MCDKGTAMEREKHKQTPSVTLWNEADGTDFVTDNVWMAG